MIITGDTPMSELMHSDSDTRYYISDEELMHWKYIKREKVNGKWRYFYDYEHHFDDLMPQEYRDYKDAESDMKTDKFMKKQAFQNYQQNLRNSDPVSKEWAKENVDEYARSSKALKESTKKYLAAKEAYMKTPVGKLHQASKKIKSGMKKVAKLLKGLFG